MPAKTAIAILSDPRSGTDEALGRVFNALSTAYECQQAGEPVTVIFLGAGTRWPSALAQSEHPAHALFESVRGAVAGVSCGCADVFGATESALACGLPLLKDNALPGTPGVASLRALSNDGYRVLTF